MSYADQLFVNMCRDILEHGTSTEGEKVRPRWEDGSFAYTMKKFGVVNRYDLREEFPAITLRKTALKSCFDEILWIWQKKSNNIKDLSSHIWDSWADETGSIGRSYGYQMGYKSPYRDVDPETAMKIFRMDEIPLISFPNLHDPAQAVNAEKYKKYHVVRTTSPDTWWMDQIDRVLYDLHVNPYSRRILTSIYVHSDLYAMHLYPCAYSMTFNVTKEPGCEKLILNGILNQRSNDLLAAGNWNVSQYALLLMMTAQSCGMIAGELLHVIADAHIYDRHIPIVKELIQREQYPAPKVWLDPDVKHFYDFTTDHLHVENYVTGPQVKNIPIAV